MKAELGNWQLIEKIGSGAFGYVYTCKNLKDTSEKVYAIKLSKGGSRDKGALLSEIDIHSRLTHPNIVSFIQGFDIDRCVGFKKGITLAEMAPNSGDCCGMVLEYLYVGTVTNYVKNHEIGEDFVQRVARDMISALLYLQEQRILHLDVKDENILMDNGKFKLSDFGFSRKIERVGGMKNVGTPYFMAPERITNQSFGFPGEVWSLGVTLFRIFHGALPWKSGSMGQLIEEVKIGVPAREGLAEESVYLRNLINQMLIVDPSHRITLTACLSHPFVRPKYTGTPEWTQEEFEHFSNDHVVFGPGSRDQFYLWLAAQYPNDSPVPLTKFGHMYEALQAEIAEDMKAMDEDPE